MQYWGGMVAHAEQSGWGTGFTIRPSHQSTPAQGPTHAAVTHDFQPTEVLGEGGMGVVYKAKQHTLERLVAVKKLKSNEQSRDIANFLKEARITGNIDHPNVVPVHGLHRSTGGDWILSMKLVEGKNWKELQNQAPNSLEKNLRILLSVCSAVRFAHEKKGVIHRDLKPENIMIGDYGEVLVMDWGLAIESRQIEEAKANPGKFPRSPCGTPSYMSPEMADGHISELGPWTDVFLLGGILHWLMTGQSPYPGQDFWGTIVSAVKCQPKSYDDASIPDELAQLAQDAMQAEVSERIGTVREFEQRLEQHLGHKESLTLSQTAAKMLQKDEVSFNDFSRAIAGFEQSLKMWPENERARLQLQDARIQFAMAALEAGDLAMLQAQIDNLEKSGRDCPALREAAEEALSERRRNERQRKLFKAVAVSLLVLLVLGAGATLLLLERTKLQARRQRLQAYVKQAEDQWQEYQDLETQRPGLLRDLEVARRLERLKPYAPLSATVKTKPLKLGRELRLLEARLREMGDSILFVADNATDLASDDAKTKKELTDLQAEILSRRILEAERNQNQRLYQRLLADLVRRCGERHEVVSRLLQSQGKIDVSVTVEDAKVELFRYVEDAKTKRLVLGHVSENGQLVDDKVPTYQVQGRLKATLKSGSYCALISHPGKLPVRYPFCIERDKRWPDDFVRGPEDRLKAWVRRCRTIQLYDKGKIEDGLIVIAAGPFQRGPSKAWRTIPYDFFISETEVTITDWESYQERLSVSSVKRVGSLNGRVRYNVLKTLWPAIELSWFDAQRYCVFESSRRSTLTLGAVRMPSDLEWEKAARGVDGRLFPWGQHFDWSFTNGGYSHAGGPELENIKSNEADCSPYGVYDMAGNVREWTGFHHEAGFVESVDAVTGQVCTRNFEMKGLSVSYFGNDSTQRSVRGGSWSMNRQDLFHNASRNTERSQQLSADIGFRIVRVPKVVALEHRRESREWLKTLVNESGAANIDKLTQLEQSVEDFQEQCSTVPGDARLLESLAKALIGLSEFELSLASFELAMLHKQQAIQSIRVILQSKPSIRLQLFLVESLVSTAELLMLQNELDQAEDYSKQAMNLLEGLKSEPHFDGNRVRDISVRCMRIRAEHQFKNQRFQQAIDIYKALVRSDTQYSLNNLRDWQRLKTTAKDLVRLAGMYQAQSQQLQAKVLYKQALKILNKPQLSALNTPEVDEMMWDVFYGLSIACQGVEREQFLNATAARLRELIRREGNTLKNHGRRVRLLDLRIHIYKDMGQVKQARETIEIMLKSWRDTLKNYGNQLQLMEQMAEAVSDSAEYYVSSSMRQEALSLLQESEQTLKRILERDPHRSSALFILTKVHLRQAETYRNINKIQAGLKAIKNSLEAVRAYQRLVGRNVQSKRYVREAFMIDSLLQKQKGRLDLAKVAIRSAMLAQMDMNALLGDNTKTRKQTGELLGLHIDIDSEYRDIDPNLSIVTDFIQKIGVALKEHPNSVQDLMTLSTLYFRIAEVYLRRQKDVKACQYFRGSYNINAKLIKVAPKNLAFLKELLGAAEAYSFAANRNGQPQLALDLAKESQLLLQKVMKDQGPVPDLIRAEGIVCQRLSAACMKLNKNLDALTWAKRCLKLRRELIQSLGESDRLLWDLAHALDLMTEVHKRCQNLDQALACAEEALIISQKRRRMSGDIVPTLDDLCVSYMKISAIAGKERAVEALKDGIKIARMLKQRFPKSRGLQLEKLMIERLRSLGFRD